MSYKHLKCITINTDASFHPQKKIGGYAFYIVCDSFKIQKGGYFKGYVKNAMEAEMMCIANAVYTLCAQKELPSTDLIVINSDCLFAFEKMTRKSQNKVGRKVANLIRELRKHMSFRGVIMPRYEFRHVKAHNGTNDARSYVNDWCDKEAKKWMRKLSKIKTEKQ